MVRLSFAKDLSSLKGCDSLLVVAPERAFSRPFPKIGTPKIRRLIVELASDTKAGDRGNTATTLTGGDPKRLTVGVLPNRVSRYNAPSRPGATQYVVGASGISSAKKGMIVLVLEEVAHLLPSLIAVGRAFPMLNMKSAGGSGGRLQILALTTKGEALKISPYFKEVFAASRTAASLVDSPPTDLNPEALAERARTWLEDVPRVEIEEFVGDDLLKHNLGGIHAVGRCAVKAPRMLVARYEPKTESKHHIALVGKGITFDTGGLHLKGRGSMETMKADMGGSAAVLGAFRALAKSGVEQRVTLVMCIAENAIGPAAYKPDDVLHMHSGKTVEVNNTDAEGRLLLADGVSYAARVLQADFVFNAATLTGAQMIATGSNHAAVVSNDRDLESLFIKAGTQSGDLAHPLPFAPEFYKAEFKSPLADMRNSVKNRANAQSSCAAQFVYNHLDKTGVKWAHVDLAGPAFRADRGTGYGVALLAEVVQALS